MQKQINTPVFQTYFQAETFLEKQGYHCENEQWKKQGAPIATAVPLHNGVQIHFSSTQH